MESEFIQWLTIPNPTQTVVEDISRIGSNPMVPSDMPIYG